MISKFDKFITEAYARDIAGAEGDHEAILKSIEIGSGIPVYLFFDKDDEVLDILSTKDVKSYMNEYDYAEDTTRRVSMMKVGDCISTSINIITRIM